MAALEVTSEIAKLLSNLLVEDDDDEDIVRFSFPNVIRQIKCSICLLSKVSPVFEAMFTENWHTKKTVKMDDFVQFNQFLTFRLFVNMLYGLLEFNSLTIGDATNAFFYSHKYQVEIVNDRILSFLHHKVAIGSLSLIEFRVLLDFAQLFNLTHLMAKLDHFDLKLDVDNCYELYQLADQMNLKKIKQRVIGYCVTVQPKAEWSSEFLCLVIASMQQKMPREGQLDKAKEDEKNEVPAEGENKKFGNGTVEFDQSSSNDEDLKSPPIVSRKSPPIVSSKSPFHVTFSTKNTTNGNSIDWCPSKQRLPLDTGRPKIRRVGNANAYRIDFMNKRKY